MAVIGDDLDADIYGGARVGAFTIAVKTGKFREEHLPQAKTQPDLLWDSIANLPAWVEKITKKENKK